ncbi:MAG: YibE/F family protein, partial [Clostridiales bacterium]|nr:YibE/F family protein [Clostridiales bacterium]
RGFARTGGADERRRLPGLCGEGHVVQNIFVRPVVTEADIAECDKACFVLPESLRMFRVFDGRLRFNHFGNAVCGHRGAVSTLVTNYAYDLPYLQIINSYNIGIEIMQGISGSLGVILTVPLVAAFSAFANGGKRKALRASGPITGNNIFRGFRHGNLEAIVGCRKGSGRRSVPNGCDSSRGGE